jgi:hypothetical protein
VRLHSVLARAKRQAAETLQEMMGSQVPLDRCRTAFDGKVAPRTLRLFFILQRDAAPLTQHHAGSDNHMGLRIGEQRSVTSSDMLDHRKGTDYDRRR